MEMHFFKAQNIYNLKWLFKLMILGQSSRSCDLLFWVGVRRRVMSVVCYNLFLKKYCANLYQIWYVVPVRKGGMELL